MSVKNYRLYALAHTWLSPIQKGIQVSHMTAELCFKQHSDNQNDMVSDWAEKDKTLILLNGGPSVSLKEAKAIFEETDIFPFADFFEDEASLEGAMTAVGIILPEYVYSQFKSFKNILSKNKNYKKDNIFIQHTSEYQETLKLWLDANISLFDSGKNPRYDKIIKLNKIASILAYKNLA